MACFSAGTAAEVALLDVVLVSDLLARAGATREAGVLVVAEDAAANDGRGEDSNREAVSRLAATTLAACCWENISCCCGCCWDIIRGATCCCCVVVLPRVDGANAQVCCCEANNRADTSKRIGLIMVLDNNISLLADL